LPVSAFGWSPKALGDCYLFAASMTLNATMVTFDRAFAELAKRHARTAIVLA